MANPIPPVDGGVAAEDSLAAGVIRRYEERLAKDPASLAFAPLADAYRKAGRLEEAIKLCREGLGRFPHYTTARLILAKAYMDEGSPDIALAELGTILEANSRDLQAHRLAAEIHRKGGRWDRVVAHLERVVALDPADRESRVMLEVLKGGGRVAEGSPLAAVLADDTFATATFAALCIEQGLVDEGAQIFLRLARRNRDPEQARALIDQALRAKRERRKGP